MVLAEKKQYSAIQPESNLSPVARAGTAARRRPLYALMILAGFALCMLYTYQTTRIISLGYQAENVQGDISSLQTANNRMELEIAQLQAPIRVEQIARNKLGMTDPDNFLVASAATEELSPEPQAVSQVPKSTWSSRLLALLPRFTGRAEASTR